MKSIFLWFSAVWVYSCVPSLIMKEDIASLTLQDDEWLVDFGASESIAGFHFCLVQVYDVPVGFYNEQLARQFRNFLGTFLDYDSKALVFSLQKCLRVWVRLDVQLPLKRKKCFVLSHHQYVYASF
ncbi:hypothetical protein J1N35_005555 [Gossypium stocksii]|uniref:Uncharacterized protein n=1 Tax=Gossypium stocksii TaxID=47602 RepID=A0A9D3WFI6_9ROSI|nr:hypothetical protein J1N35_005555 [Gossypium stocksii]